MATLSIGSFAIKQLDGLFSLNDLHHASGGESKHQPAFFLRLDQTQALIAEISNSANLQNYAATKTIRGKFGGTYACREIVIAYAAWINPAFHLKVIRVFLAVATPSTIDPAQKYASAARMAHALLDVLSAFDLPRAMTHAIAVEHIRRETGVELASAFAKITDQLALTPERRELLEREALRIVNLIPADNMPSAHDLLSEITKAQRSVAALPAIA